MSGSKAIVIKQEGNEGVKFKFPYDILNFWKETNTTDAFKTKLQLFPKSKYSDEGRGVYWCFYLPNRIMENSSWGGPEFLLVSLRVENMVYTL